MTGAKKRATIDWTKQESTTAKDFEDEQPLLPPPREFTKLKPYEGIFDSASLVIERPSKREIVERSFMQILSALGFAIDDENVKDIVRRMTELLLALGKNRPAPKQED